MLRGDVFTFRAPPPGSGSHVQGGRRLAVILQADELLPRSVVVIAPTSRSARAASFRPEVEVAGEPTRVLVEQLGVVDVSRLGDRIDHLSRLEMWGVDESLRVVLDLR